jgi:hypothetical protein
VAALVIGLLASVAAAFLLLCAIDRESPVDRITGEALLLAPALPAGVLGLASLLSIEWSRGLLAVGGIAVVVGLALLRGWTGRRRPVAVDRSRLDLALAVPLAVLVLLLLLGYAQFAFVSAGAENDFIGIWGAKGRTFFESGGVDREYLTSHWRAYAHPDYPILVPLIFASVAVLAGGWSESLSGLVYVVLAMGGLVLVRAELRKVTGRVAIQALGVLAVVPFVMSPWIGLADGPLALLALAALLRLGSGLDGGARPDFTIGGIFLGLAMATKNEGVALGVIAILLLALRRRNGVLLVALWPTVAIAAPWLVVRSVLGLSTDLFEGGALSRVVARLTVGDELTRMLEYLVVYRPGQWILYLAFICVFVLWRRRLTVGAWFILAVAALQVLTYLGAYLVTPLPLEWHVRWSWERLLSQIGASLAVVAIVTLARVADKVSVRRGFLALVGPGPEVEDQQADADADR